MNDMFMACEGIASVASDHLYTLLYGRNGMYACPFRGSYACPEHSGQISTHLHVHECM